MLYNAVVARCRMVNVRAVERWARPHGFEAVSTLHIPAQPSAAAPAEAVRLQRMLGERSSGYLNHSVVTFPPMKRKIRKFIAVCPIIAPATFRLFNVSQAATKPKVVTMASVRKSPRQR